MQLCLLGVTELNRSRKRGGRKLGQRMLLRIEQGKGSKDRFAMLSPQLLELLRDWWRIERSQGWLFPGQNPVNRSEFALLS
jgi:integrase